MSVRRRDSNGVRRHHVDAGTECEDYANNWSEDHGVQTALFYFIVFGSASNSAADQASENEQQPEHKRKHEFSLLLEVSPALAVRRLAELLRPIKTNK